MATQVIIPFLACTKIPPNISFEEAATIPAVYGTAFQAIIIMGEWHRLQCSKPKVKHRH
jgi:NADPH:quinone reductase-like Zn-dependent oxidoreductase